MPQRNQKTKIQKSQKSQKSQKKPIHDQLQECVVTGSICPEHVLCADVLAAEISDGGGGKLSRNTWDRAVDYAMQIVEGKCLDKYGELGPMGDKTKSVGLHDKDTWAGFVADVTRQCRHATNLKAKQAGVDNKAYKCFLDDVASQLGITPGVLKPMIGTKPLGITKTRFLNKRAKCLPEYTTEVVQTVTAYCEGNDLRQERLAEAIVATGLADGDDAPQLAQTELQGDKGSTREITEAYRKADQCLGNASYVPADVAAVITSDLEDLIGKYKDTLAKAVAEQHARSPMMQYAIALRETGDTLDSDPHYATLTLAQRNEAIQRCLRKTEPSTEIQLTWEKGSPGCSLLCLVTLLLPFIVS